jgi:hypothetical protein
MPSKAGHVQLGAQARRKGQPLERRDSCFKSKKVQLMFNVNSLDRTMQFVVLMKITGVFWKNSR